MGHPTFCVNDRSLASLEQDTQLLVTLVAAEGDQGVDA
jgi:hypothetical protein